jgi:VanZ family protein
MSSPLFWPRAVFGLLFVIITFLTLTPNPVESEPGFALTRWIANYLLGDAKNADKIGHFLAYACLGLTAFWAQLAVLSKRWAVTLALAAYGVLLEGLQGLGGVRSPEVADAVANGLGALAGFAGALVLVRLNKFRAP